MGQLQFMGVLLSEETHYHLHNTVMHVQALMNVVLGHYITPACTQICLLQGLERYVGQQDSCFI